MSAAPRTPAGPDRSARLQAAKATVLAFQADLDAAGPDDVAAVIARHVAPDYRWRGVYPFAEQNGADAVAKVFWEPLRRAMGPMQRRPDVFLAGFNDVVVDQRLVDAESEGRADDEPVWVCQMGHHLGLFDEPWLDIPPTNKMCFVRYAEFNAVAGGRITESAVFVDVISVMRQAGHYPLPPQTGSSHIYPGPMTHDGLLLEPQAEQEGVATMDLVNRMCTDLFEANRIANEGGDDRVPAEVLARTWHHDMIWSGPEGIGATYTIERYQQQHQYPFRFNLGAKDFNGHVARFAEGTYACFFGWPNLTNTPTGGFLGLPGNDVRADMRVVDVYRRRDDKLAENWVFIDLLHWLKMQGLDVLERMRQLNGERF